MTRKFLSAVALMVAVVFTGAIVAEAASVNFGGQFRPRFEMWNQGSDSGLAGPIVGVAPSDPNDAHFINMRVRLNANVKIDEKTSGFIQFQTNTTFGSSAGTPGAAGSGQPFGNASNPANANDTTTDVGLHQAYFTLEDIFGSTGTAFQAGRQEVVLDGHRLFGNTGWTQGAQSHDALRLTHKHDNMTALYVFSKIAEQSVFGLVGGGSQDDVDDTEAHILWLNWKGLENEGSSTSAYLVLVDNDCNTAGTGNGCTGNLATPGSQDFWTFGARHAAGHGNLTYRVEGYYQAGKSGSTAVPVTGATGDMSAFMFGARVGWKSPDVTTKPVVTLWYDYLSGTSNGSAQQGDLGTFNTLFDTGHKFYGFMDQFLGAQTAGLHDMAIKLAMQPAAKTTLKLDLHNFSQTTQTLGTNRGAKTLGQEIDLTAIYKYSASTNVSAGYSHFFTRDAMQNVPDLQDYDWLYVMFDVKF